MKQLIANITWLKDEHGDYWVANLYNRGKKIGVTGSFYDVLGGKRSSKEIQEMEIAETYIIMTEEVGERNIK